MRDVVGADRTGAAAAVVDDDGAELWLDPLRPDAADDVVHAGRNRRDDEPDRADGIALLRPRRHDAVIAAASNPSTSMPDRFTVLSVSALAVPREPWFGC